MEEIPQGPFLKRWGLYHVGTAIIVNLLTSETNRERWTGGGDLVGVCFGLATLIISSSCRLLGIKFFEETPVMHWHVVAL